MKKNVLLISVLKLSLLFFLSFHFGLVSAHTSRTPGPCPLPTEFTSEVFRIETSPVTFEARINWNVNYHSPTSVKLYIGGILQRSDVVMSSTIYYTDLKANTIYNIVVRPFCRPIVFGSGGYEFTTPPSADCAPVQNLNVTGTTSSLTATWDYPSAASFEYKVLNYFAGIVVAEGTTTDHTISVNDLFSNTDYKVIIKAFCDSAYPDAFGYFETEFYTQCSVVSDVAVKFTPTQTSPVAFVAYLYWQGGNYRGNYELILTGGDSETLLTVSTPWYSFENLKPDTEYTLQVRTHCNGAPSDWVTYAFRTPVAPVVWCSVNSQSVFDDYIHIVSLNTIDNTSYFQLNQYGEPTGYKDYTNLSTTLIEGETYTLHVSAGLAGQTPDALRYFAAWIDYNKDGDFDDAGERVALGSSDSNSVDFNFTVPFVEAVTTRLRVEVKNNSSGTETEPQPCGLIAAGEIEDYTVIISPPAAGAGARQIALEKESTTENSTSEKNFSLSPNPVRDILTVNGLLDPNTELVVINQVGQTVFTSSSSRLEVSSLAPGIYNLIIMQNGQRISLRFVKR